jgi:hypothetical protein
MPHVRLIDVPSFCLWYYTGDPSAPWQGPSGCNCGNCSSIPPTPPANGQPGFIPVACLHFDGNKHLHFHVPAGWRVDSEPYHPKRGRRNRRTTKAAGGSK